ncbi:CidA/LrgA family holin-like protein [Salinibacillus aidingensis]|uniref:CidA/LrgA family holin-like protein n=1 Tax=Salinibacillus aidingensis TaxID=237684 RepID=A0ABN1BMP0_9BACI
MGNVYTLAKVILQIGIISLFYMVGTWIQQLFHLMIPGSIIGMLLLFVTLLTTKFKPAWIEDGANLLIKHLPLLFIPVTVGIINYLFIFEGKGLVLIPIAFVSTILVIAGSGAVSQYLAGKKVTEHE